MWNGLRGKSTPAKYVKDFMYRDEETAAMEQVKAFFDRFDREFKH